MPTEAPTTYLMHLSGPQGYWLCMALTTLAILLLPRIFGMRPWNDTRIWDLQSVATLLVGAIVAGLIWPALIAFLVLAAMLVLAALVLNFVVSHVIGGLAALYGIRHRPGRPTPGSWLLPADLLWLIDPKNAAKQIPEDMATD